MYSVLTGHSGINFILIFNKTPKHSNSFCLFILNLNLQPSSMTTLDTQNSPLSFKVRTVENKPSDCRVHLTTVVRLHGAEMNLL